MNPANRIHPADTEFLTCQYETLRANALGAINGACNLTLFLRHGMEVWLRALGNRGPDQRATDSASSSVAVIAQEERPGAALAAILADAILDQTWLPKDCGAIR